MLTGWPGSVHDARVLRNTSLYHNAESNNLIEPTCHLLGDAAFPVRSWLLVPFKDNGYLSVGQQNFNYVLSSNRIVIEQVFGRWKKRFQRMLYCDIELSLVSICIVATLALHNFCEASEEDLSNIALPPGYDVQRDNHDGQASVDDDNKDGHSKRYSIMEHLL